MGDPRNVAHAKKVTQEKQHKGASQPRKQKQAKHPAAEASSAPAAAEAPKPEPTQVEQSLAILAQLRDMEFHSRANIEKLAGLSLTIEEELKQKAFAEPFGELYSAQDAFHSKVSALIEAYATECERMKPAS